jgi:hypothetical protein
LRNKTHRESWNDQIQDAHRESSADQM